ncbi:LPXTG cell wall anchor domain-containing protein [Streptomyces abyssomicinicus]|uniref:LPXTG cell wall anchor domain-containing protein n=1 Tax=Streptomyces abyssomicinicus TaxID=574929 RepID=UPI001250A741|nr:LPXTG cell wall anchor domain-containing protein [Streptomyces abyssomicinicus]
MSLRSLPLRAAAVPAAAALLLAGAAVPAAATGGAHHTEEIRQGLPVTAEGFRHGDCPTVPAGEDGWHFVLPGGATVFTELTVTFEPGGEQVVTAFGPPTGKHAYAVSEPGAELVSAVARTEGADVSYFNLSHTCPAATGGGEENPGEEKPHEEQPGEANPGEENTGKENTGEENTGEESPGDGTEGGTAGEPAGSPAGEPAAGATGSPAPVRGDLAETGAGTTVSLGFAAVLMLAAGGAIAVRNRGAATHR